ncbi:MAG: alpha/beta fold hydrolase BchO [Pseudomonadota bacterium]
MNAAVTRNPPSYWPGRENGSRAKIGDVSWYFQRSGQGTSKLLFLHGTGASAHSWNPVARYLEDKAELLLVDLPGQGFSEIADPSRISLEGMAKALRLLLDYCEFSPTAIVGHSAGAAIACGLCLRGSYNPDHVISVNGALLPFGRAAAPVLSSAAQLLASSRMVPYVVAAHAVTRYPIERMLRRTGSALNKEMARCYRTLMASPTHVSGTLRMMANWDLHQLERNLDRLEPRLHLLVGGSDEVVSPRQAYELLDRLSVHSAATDSKGRTETEVEVYLRELPALGHLAHEEAPERLANEISEIVTLN